MAKDSRKFPNTHVLSFLHALERLHRDLFSHTFAHQQCDVTKLAPRQYTCHARSSVLVRKDVIGRYPLPGTEFFRHRILSPKGKTSRDTPWNTGAQRHGREFGRESGVLPSQSRLKKSRQTKGNRVTRWAPLSIYMGFKDLDTKFLIRPRAAMGRARARCTIPSNKALLILFLEQVSIPTN